MNSWVYLFSQFTPEALLFEALAICVLFCGYAAFWVLKKRRYGVVNQAVPAGLVKVYLNELIQDANQLRTQLFGLLRTTGAEIEPGLSQAMLLQKLGANLNTTDLKDPALVQQISQLELKMAEQNKALQEVVLEKQKIEKALADAKAQGASKDPGTPGSPDSGELAALKEKINLLEGRLAEYSVIEDDLANLKRLQQENAQLKAKLQGQDGTEEPASSEPLASEPALAETASEESAISPEPAMVSPEETETAFAAQPEAAPEESKPEAALSSDSLDAVLQAEKSVGTEEAAPDAAFEGLVDQVEQSLQPAAVETTDSGQLDNVEKSDADLVAEFEKMLKP